MQAKRERFAGLQLKIILLFMGLLVGLGNQNANSFDDNLVKQKTLPLCKIINGAVIILTIDFPKGYHLIKDVESSYTLSLGENVLSKDKITTNKTKIGIPQLSINNDTLVLNIKYYYCTEAGICFFQFSRWNIPVELRKDGSEELKIIEMPEISKRLVLPTT